MQFLNQRFYRKTWMIEFCLNDVPVDAFAFSVPAQREEFQNPQRISETKTFGGIVYDDYGNDTGKITLSGTSINEEIKRIYCGEKKAEKQLGGADEIHLLREKLKEYGKQEKLKGKTVYLYELNPQGTKYTEIKKQVLISDYTITRSKENPLQYNYTINFIVIENDTKAITSKEFLKKFTDAIDKACDKINDLTSILEDGLNVYRKAIDFIAKVKNNVSKVKNAIQNLENIISGYVETTADIIKETLKLGDFIIDESIRITLGSGIEIYNAAKELNDACNDVVNYIEDFASNKTAITQDILEKYQMTTDDIVNTWKVIAGDITDQSAMISTLTKKGAVNTSYAIIPGGTNQDDTVIVTFGFTKTTVDSATTWDALALKYYGNSEYGNLIALYNSSNGGKTELNAGEQIYIPILSNSYIANEDNEVYCSPSEKDNYGKDILINEDGDLATHLDDFKLVENKSNLSQAINMRLRTAINTRIRNITYGIRASIGNPELAKPFIISSIKSTLLEDPRVQSIEGLVFTGIGDDIKLEIVYTDINNNTQSYGGTI